MARLEESVISTESEGRPMEPIGVEISYGFSGYFSLFSK